MEKVGDDRSGLRARIRVDLLLGGPRFLLLFNLKAGVALHVEPLAQGPRKSRQYEIAMCSP